MCCALPLLRLSSSPPPCRALLAKNLRRQKMASFGQESPDPGAERPDPVTGDLCSKDGSGGVMNGSGGGEDALCSKWYSPEAGQSLWLSSMGVWKKNTKLD
ncbi:hypothetical protein BRADI_1g18540v3 [Brachypodium distachyon]|uniref:Uncharacterized protein n=1 Tax=Brachypodium distachyon TaxID=15368 RepID=I1GRE6_BRADI|nr:hypothetical protein BRADI_1g18540v3 [Brachypodium distachyon]